MWLVFNPASTTMEAGCRARPHALCQKPTPDARYAPQFWTGVANAFKGNGAVVFDLFNEPYPKIGSDWNKTLGRQCWRDGGTCTPADPLNNIAAS